jgi:hypothetical protein
VNQRCRTLISLARFVFDAPNFTCYNGNLLQLLLAVTNAIHRLGRPNGIYPNLSALYDPLNQCQPLFAPQRLAHSRNPLPNHTFASIHSQSVPHGSPHGSQEGLPSESQRKRPPSHHRDRTRLVSLPYELGLPQSSVNAPLTFFSI